MIGLGALAVGLWATGTVADVVPDDDVSAPTRLTATPLSPTSVSLDWRGSDDADSYVVRIGPDRSFADATTRRISARTSTLTLSDLAAANPGIDQYFRVEAVRGAKVTSSRTGRFTLKPGDIGKVSVPKVTASGVKARWKEVPNSRQYDVAVARDKAFSKDVEVVRTLEATDTFVTKGLAAATAYWMMVRPVNADQVGEFGKPVRFTTEPDQTSFRVGTWNVCSEKCSGYAGRARIMAEFLNANKIDVFGLQEAGGLRVGPTTNAAFSGGSQGFTRASGGAKARYIFYRPELFNQLGGSYFDIGDGRYATWAKFEVKETKKVFYFVDVHLENEKSKDAARSAETSVMLSRMAQINGSGAPIIYAGDFNSGRHRPADSPGVKVRAAGLQDSVELAADPVNTQYNSAHGGGGVLRSGDWVDHIFVSKDFEVLGWKQLVRLSGSRYAQPFVTDHNALSADVALDAAAKSVGKATPASPVTGPAASLR